MTWNSTLLFKLLAPEQYSVRISNSYFDKINASLITDHCINDGYAEK